MIGCMIAFVMNVLLQIIEAHTWKATRNKKWKKYKRPVCLTLTLFIILSVFALLLCLVAPALKNTTQIFVKNIPAYKEESTTFLKKIGIGTKEIDAFNKHLDTAKKDVSTFLEKNGTSITKALASFASNMITGIVNIGLGIVFSIYILAQKEKLGEQANKIMVAYLPKKKILKIKEIASLSNMTFTKFITGQVTEAVIIGILCFIGMLILQIPYAPTISVLVGFTALIPVFGAFIGTLIGAFLIFMTSPMKALFFIIFILILQQIEGNFIYPKVVGKSVGLPSIWVMVAVTIGASMGGILGMMISVPMCSILYSIFTVNVKTRLKNKKTYLPSK